MGTKEGEERNRNGRNGMEGIEFAPWWSPGYATAFFRHSMQQSQTYNLADFFEWTQKIKLLT